MDAPVRGGVFNRGASREYAPSPEQLTAVKQKTVVVYVEDNQAFEEWKRLMSLMHAR